MSVVAEQRPIGGPSRVMSLDSLPGPYKNRQFGGSAHQFLSSREPLATGPLNIPLPSGPSVVFGVGIDGENSFAAPRPGNGLAPSTSPIHIYKDRFQHDRIVFDQGHVPPAGVNPERLKYDQSYLPSYIQHDRTPKYNGSNRTINEECWSFQQGHCRLGDSCSRIHSLSHPRAQASIPPNRFSRSEQWRGPIASHYTQHHRGNNLAPDAVFVASNIVSWDLSTEVIPEGVCEEYRRSGVCGRYGNCKYTHIPPGAPLPMGPSSGAHQPGPLRPPPRPDHQLENRNQTQCFPRVPAYLHPTHIASAQPWTTRVSHINIQPPSSLPTSISSTLPSSQTTPFALPAPNVLPVARVVQQSFPMPHKLPAPADQPATLEQPLLNIPTLVRLPTCSIRSIDPPGRIEMTSTMSVESPAVQSKSPSPLVPVSFVHPSTNGLVDAAPHSSQAAQPEPQANLSSPSKTLNTSVRIADSQSAQQAQSPVLPSTKSSQIPAVPGEPSSSPLSAICTSTKPADMAAHGPKAQDKLAVKSIPSLPVKAAKPLVTSSDVRVKPAAGSSGGDKVVSPGDPSRVSPPTTQCDGETVASQFSTQGILPPKVTPAVEVGVRGKSTPLPPVHSVALPKARGVEDAGHSRGTVKDLLAEGAPSKNSDKAQQPASPSSTPPVSETLAPTSDQPPDASKSVGSTRGLCWKFRRGGCSRGPHCQYWHPKRSESQPEVNLPSVASQFASVDSSKSSQEIQLHDKTAGTPSIDEPAKPGPSSARRTEEKPRTEALSPQLVNTGSSGRTTVMSTGSDLNVPPTTLPTQSGSTQRQKMTNKELDRICRNYLHGCCFNAYQCYRKHVPRCDWDKYYAREDLCPDGPEKCWLVRCQFKQSREEAKENSDMAVATEQSQTSEGLNSCKILESEATASSDRTNQDVGGGSQPEAPFKSSSTHQVEQNTKTSSSIIQKDNSVADVPRDTSSPNGHKPQKKKKKKKKQTKSESGSSSAIATTDESSDKPDRSAIGGKSEVEGPSEPPATKKAKVTMTAKPRQGHKGSSANKSTDSSPSIREPVPLPTQCTTVNGSIVPEKGTKKSRAPGGSNGDVNRLLQKLQDSADKSTSQDHKKTPHIAHKKVQSMPSVPPGLGLKASSTTSSQQPPQMTTLTVFDATKVTLGPGFEVHHLMTGFESRDIIIKNVPEHITSDDIKDMLKPFGEVFNVHIPEHKKDQAMNVKASFTNHLDAGAAVAALDGADLFGITLDITLASTCTGKAVVRDGDVYLEFPPPSKIGFAGYANRAMAETAIAQAAESAVYGEVYEGLPTLGAVNVRFHGLPPKAQRQDLQRLGEPEGVMLGHFNYMRLESALEQLHETLDRFGDLEALDVLPPPYTKGIVRAWARFKSPNTADRVCTALDFRSQWFIGNERLSARHQRSLAYTLPVNVFDALAFDIRYLRYCACTIDNRCNIIIVDRRKHANVTVVMVKLIADSLPVLTRLKASFERLLRGDQVTSNGSTVWDPYFVTKGGNAYLNDLQQSYPGVVINKDTRKRVLALFGPPGRRRLVREALLTKVEELRLRPYKKFSLRGRLIGLFMSADLAKLHQELGSENVTLDLADQSLTVRGNEDAFQVARLAILHASRRHVDERKQSNTTCPVCFDEVSSPVSLECGHTWCKACLSDYLLASVDNRVFPLTCLGNEAHCSQHITLEVAREILSSAQLTSIIQASYLSHIHSRASEFHHCPTPDCPQIYRSPPKGTVLHCPSCLVRICGDCHKEHHEGLCRYNESEDMKLFAEWTKGHDVKKCPGCKAAIERSAGCNHMTCTRCKTHICWVCMATFPNGDEVYDHMHAAHGGIGL